MKTDPVGPLSPSVGADLRALYPDLSPILGDRWLVAQGALDGRARAPLYGWADPSGPDHEFLRDLADAVYTLRTLPGLSAHLRRLQGPTPEFWAALCELKMATRLTRAGIRATLHPDTPDIRAHMDDGTVGIELTAGFPTLRFRDLQEALTHAWNQSGRLILLCPDETDRFLTTERDALIDRVRSTVYDDLLESVVPEEDLLSDGGYIYRDEGFDLEERRVPTDDIVDPARLEVFLSPAPYPVVVTRSGARWGYDDPWPDIVAAAEDKSRKLPNDEPGIVAFEGGFSSPSAHLWARLVADRRVDLELRLKAHVAGVLCYWQDARRTLPGLQFFVWNEDFAGERGRVERVLNALEIAI